MPEARVNGEERDLPDGTTLAQLVERFVGPRDVDGVAAAVNREVVPRSQWTETRIGEDDDIEIIAPFQGG